MCRRNSDWIFSRTEQNHLVCSSHMIYNSLQISLVHILIDRRSTVELFETLFCRYPSRFNRCTTKNEPFSVSHFSHVWFMPEHNFQITNGQQIVLGEINWEATQTIANECASYTFLESFLCADSFGEKRFCIQLVNEGILFKRLNKLEMQCRLVRDDMKSQFMRLKTVELSVYMEC